MKKTIIIPLILLVSLACVVPTVPVSPSATRAHGEIAPVTGSQEWRVIAYSLNVREAPSDTGRVVSTLNYGDIVTVDTGTITEDKHGTMWCEHQHGWSACRYLQLIDSD